MIETARTTHWEELSEGAAVALSFRIDSGAMAAFADLSGDHNPLHLDDTFARRAGFAGRVVFGGLILAQVSRLLGMHLPGQFGVWTGIKLDFRAPLYIGEEATVEGRIEHLSAATRSLTLRLLVQAGERKVATGKAFATVKEHG